MAAEVVLNSLHLIIVEQSRHQRRKSRCESATVRSGGQRQMGLVFKKNKLRVVPSGTGSVDNVKSPSHELACRRPDATRIRRHMN